MTENTNTKFCMHCGSKVCKEAEVCTSCGRELNKNVYTNSSTKKCKKCGEQINKDLKKCPQCGTRQGMPVWLIVVIAIVVVIFVSSNSDNNSSLENNGNSNNTYVNQSKPENNSGPNNEQTNQPSETIEYIKVTKDDLDEALDNNAALARETYNGKYVEVSGRLGTIDSELKYFSLKSSTEEWDFIGIHCKIKNKEQKEVVKTLTRDQEIIIKGKITDVGEVLGYYLDTIEIIPE